MSARPVPFLPAGTALVSGHGAFVLAKLGERHLRPLLARLDPADGTRQELEALLRALELAAREWEDEATTSDPRSPAVAGAAIVARSSHDEPEEVGTTEVAAMLNVSERRVLQLIGEGHLIGDQRHRGTPWRISRASVLAYRQERDAA